METKPGTSDGQGQSPPTGPTRGPTGPKPPVEQQPKGEKKDSERLDPGLVPYNPDVQRIGGFVAGAAIGGVPYGGVVAAVLIRNGVLAPGTSQSREGLAQGMAVGGIVWTVLRLSKPTPPQQLTPATAGGGPTPPVAVQTSGAGVSVIAQIGLLVNEMVGIGEMTVTASTGGGNGEGHHVATNKNYKAGKQWSKIFEKIFAQAGLTLKDPNNVVDVEGHQGPHPPRYHEIIHTRLKEATEGRSGDAYRDALLKELAALREEIRTPGTELNDLVTRRGP